MLGKFLIVDKWWMKLIVSLLSTIGQGSEVTRRKEIVDRGRTDRSCYVLNLHVQNSGHNAPSCFCMFGKRAFRPSFLVIFREKERKQEGFWLPEPSSGGTQWTHWEKGTVASDLNYFLYLKDVEQT